jgi:hypothetical protein
VCRLRRKDGLPSGGGPMSGPRLNVARTVKCPCGAPQSFVKGDPKQLASAIGSSCNVCGRRLVERDVGWSGRSRFAFVRAHEAP